MSITGFNELMKGYDLDEFFPEELSVISDAQVLLELIKSKSYAGETHIVKRPHDKCLCAYNGVPEVCDECPKDKIPAKVRSSLAASVLRNIRDNLNRLEIEN